TADNQLQASVKSVLFDGAKSRAIMTNNDAEEIIVSLPQTGEFSDLKAGDKLSLSWRADIAKVFTNQA
ncbi:TOBE domain-containing protein, partial [Oleiphilus sp. HI0067]